MVSPGFAIVGTGAMASTMARVLRRVGVPLRAVVSRTPERAAAFAKEFEIAAGESELNAVLARTDIQAVYVATPPHAHTATVIAALRAGKAVLCEKPIAPSEVQLAQIVTAAEQSNVLCMEAMWTFFLPAYQRFQEFAQSSKFGVPQSLAASFAYPAAGSDLNSFVAPDPAGVLLDRSIYLIALALRTLGPVESVNAQLRFDSTGVDVEAFLQLQHANGTHSQLSSSFTSLMPNTATLHCSGGLIEIKAPLIGAEALSTLAARGSYGSGSAIGARGKIKERLRESSRIRNLKRFLDRPTSHDLSFGVDGYVPQIAHFLELMEAKKAQSNIVPLSLSIESVRIIDRARTLAAR